MLSACAGWLTCCYCITYGVEITGSSIFSIRGILPKVTRPGMGRVDKRLSKQNPISMNHLSLLSTCAALVLMTTAEAGRCTFYSNCSGSFVVVRSLDSGSSNVVCSSSCGTLACCRSTIVATGCVSDGCAAPSSEPVGPSDSGDKESGIEDAQTPPADESGEEEAPANDGASA